MRRPIPAIAALLLCAAGCSYPTDRGLTRTALAALAEAKGLSESITLDETAASVVYPAKNAACVTIPCVYTNEKGERIQGSCAVWLHRIRYRWELEWFDLIPGRAAASKQATQSPS